MNNNFMRSTYIYTFFTVIFLFGCKEKNNQPSNNQQKNKINELSEYVNKYILTNDHDSISHFDIEVKRKITNLGAVFYRIRKMGGIGKDGKLYKEIVFDGGTNDIIFDSINNKFYNLAMVDGWFSGTIVTHFNLLKTISILEDDKLMPVCNDFKDLEAFLNQRSTTRYLYLNVDVIDSLFMNKNRIRIKTISELEDSFPKYNNKVFTKLKKMNQWDHFKKVIKGKFKRGSLLLYLDKYVGRFICFEIVNFRALNEYNTHFANNYNIKVVEYKSNRDIL